MALYAHTFIAKMSSIVYTCCEYVLEVFVLVELTVVAASAVAVLQSSSAAASFAAVAASFAAVETLVAGVGIGVAAASVDAGFPVGHSLGHRHSRTIGSGTPLLWLPWIVV